MRQDGFIPGKCAAFTLIEILVVVAIIATLLAITFPVLSQVRENGRRGSCASNLRQLGIALSTYSIDFDERYPVSSLDSTTVTNIAWAGQLFPHLKSADLLRCPDDSGENSTDTTTGVVTVSYGLNANLAEASSLATLASPARTVALFEVSKDHALVRETTEGKDQQPQVSASSNGSDGGLANLTGNGTERIDSARYATGKMDNSDAVTLIPPDLAQYEGSGRHQDGSNFLAADGHVLHLFGRRLSAGGNALSATAPQSRSGCEYHGLGAGAFPCAEGTANNTHALTFSVR